jgi:hypothetical protein
MIGIKTLQPSGAFMSSIDIYEYKYKSIFNDETKKVKVKFTLQEAMKAKTGSRDTLSLISTLDGSA